MERDFEDIIAIGSFLTQKAAACVLNQNFQGKKKSNIIV